MYIIEELFGYQFCGGWKRKRTSNYGFLVVFFFSYENQAHVPHVVGLLKPLQGSHPYFLPEILQVVGLSMPKEQLQKYFLLLFYL